MQLPDINASSEVYIDFADHTEGAAAAWANSSIITADQKLVVAEVATMVGGANTTLVNAFFARLGLQRLSQKAQANFGVCDVGLDFRLLGAGDAVLNGPALRNRLHPVFQAVFMKQNPGEIARSDPREEPETVQQVVDNINALPDFEGKAGVVSNLGAAITTSIQARDNWDDHIAMENQAINTELQARLTLRTVLEQAYGKLRAAFPGQRALVESFFPKRRRSDGTKKAEPPPAQNPA